MARTPTNPRKSVLDPAQIIEFLSDNPDFLQRNPELYRVMTPPDRALGDGVSDLQSAIIDRLRGDAERLKTRQRDLMITSRANLSTQGRVHECVLTLLEAPSLEHVVQVITNDFAILLDIDIVTLCLESEQDDNVTSLPIAGLRNVPAGFVDATLGEGRNVLLFDEMTREPRIFGAAADLVRSSALVRVEISSESPSAIVAFGTRNSGKFHASQGTELLDFLGRVVEGVIRSWLMIRE